MVTTVEAVLAAALQAGYLNMGEVRRIMTRTGTVPDGPGRPARLRAAIWNELLAPHDVDHGLGITLALNAGAHDFGVMGELVSHCDSLLDAYRVIGRYSRLLHPDIDIRATRQAGRIEIHYTLLRADQRIASAILAAGQLWALTLLARLPRTTLGLDVTPLRMDMACPPPRPGPWQKAEHVLGCPIHFGQKHYRLVFDRAPLERRQHLETRPARFFLEELARRMLAEMPAQSDMPTRVAESLRARLPSGRVSVTDVAGDLGVSSRTLQRRLAADKSCFRDILDRVRRREARHLLQTGQYTKNEISFLLGYAEQSVFAHALRRWAKSACMD
ncbi:helix-turn-helix domain-containing protein [Komagataeibacter diospyri]|uniref:helix-turn-helix domain-containing protein n=1 Tax=Komagataeibacter diospyri TaxID=1932662 RepID=UPI003758200D